MKVEVQCPVCGKIAHVLIEHLGKKAACPKCRGQFVLTASAPRPTAPPLPPATAGPPIPVPISAEAVPEPAAMEFMDSIPFAKRAEEARGLFGSLFGGRSSDTDLIESYSVVYRGGHPDYPKEKAGMIDLKMFSDRFEFKPTLGSKGWFKGLVIPFNKTLALDIVERKVGTVEGILGGLNSRQLNQQNNIHIKYQDDNAKDILLRLEMLSGITVMGQAKRCQVLIDRMRNHGIFEKFLRQSSDTPRNEHNDIPAQIEKLSALREKGILTTEEFEKKKADLLARM